MSSKIYNSDHIWMIMNKLNSERKSSDGNCDVTIHAGSHDFAAHKCVVSAVSGFYEKLFTVEMREKYEKKAKVEGVSEETMENILEYIYLCKITITDENVFSIMEAANFMEIPNLKDFCLEFLLDHLDLHNCLNIRAYGKRYNYGKAVMKANKIIAQEFEFIVMEESFNMLPLDDLLEIFELENKQVSSEKVVYQAMFGWIKHDLAKRSQYFKQVFGMIKLEKLDAKFLQNVAATEELVKNSHECTSMILTSILPRLVSVEDQQAVVSKKGSAEVLYVDRAQKEQERQAELCGQFEQQKQESIQRFQRVNLYVKNLDDNVTDDELREAFSQYGTITSAKIMTDGEYSRGFGFVCFSSPEEATKAITEMNGRIVGSKPLYVAWAQRREDRKAHLSAQYMQRMTTNMGVRIAAPNQMIGQSFQAAGGPGAFYMPFQNQRTAYMPGQLMRATPRWQHSPNQQFQMGDMRTVGPRGPSTAPAIRPMTAPVGGRGMHPSHTMMQHPVTAMQPFKYTQSVRNPTLSGYPQPGQPQAQQQNDQQSLQQAVHVQGQEPLTASMLAAAQPQEQKQMLGERLYPLIESSHPDLASKITGMLLEIDNSELLHMLESRESLKAKVEEAVAVLQAHQAKVVAARSGQRNGQAAAADVAVPVPVGGTQE